jgi:hypothetical protein
MLMFIKKSAQVNEDDVDPKQQTFFFSSKKFRRRRQKSQVRSSRQGPHLGLGCEVLDKTDGMCLTEMTVNWICSIGFFCDESLS